MTQFLFTGGPVLDPRHEGPREGMEVLVEDGIIREVSDRPIRSEAAERVDLAGRVLMPGLIDAHVHVIAAMADLAANAAQPNSLAALRAGHIMHAMLMRGFTTVRDVGGADRGLADAQALGVVSGPRLVISGKALSQTGGHCDSRQRYDDRAPFNRVGSMGRLCDGVDAVRRAARQELRAGADFIKVMANGGIASPSDPIHMLQFSRDELLAAVEEAREPTAPTSPRISTRTRRSAGRWSVRRPLVGALQPHPRRRPRSSRRRLGAFAVPTLITYDRLAIGGGLAGDGRPDSVAKIETVRQAGLEAVVDHARGRAARWPMARDLLGPMHRHQSGEFALRARRCCRRWRCCARPPRWPPSYAGWRAGRG